MLCSCGFLLRTSGLRVNCQIGVGSLLCSSKPSQQPSASRTILLPRSAGLSRPLSVFSYIQHTRTAASASLQDRSSTCRQRTVWTSRPWQTGMQHHQQSQQLQQDTASGHEQQRGFRRLALSNEAMQSLPTILTLGRVFSIPVLMALWFSPLQNVPELCAGIFAAAAVTDWLDGYLARRLKADSAFGAFLDPVADKLMVAAVLILLSSSPLAAGPWAGNAWLLPLLSTAIIGREITMSALREWAASLGSDAYKSVAVSSWGKWKTATQMISLTLLLLSCRGGEGTVIYYSAAAGPPLLCVAAFLTVWSLKNYMQALWKYLR